MNQAVNPPALNKAVVEAVSVGVPSLLVMPWPVRPSVRVSLPLVLLSLSMGVVVSCVSMTTTAQAPGPTVAPTEATSPSQALSLTPAALPSPASTREPLAASSPSLPPRAASTPAASVAPAAETADPSDVDVVVAAAETALPRWKQRQLQTILDNTVEKKGVAGLQVAVRFPSGETWLATAGNAEFGPDRPIEDDTTFAIASVTKTFIAALILRLAEEGKLDLDAPFGRYFDDAPRSGSVTIRQLLSHTSGIYDYFSNPRYIKASRAWLRAAPTGRNSREHQWTYEEIMGLVKDGYCKPGACYRYSNTNYVILGRVAEAVGGRPLHKQLRMRFFTPLGLEDTYYQPAEMPPPDAAHGHWPSGAGYTDHTRDAEVLPFMAAVSVADAAGAIASTARDLSVWADALYGGKVLSADSLEQMTTFLAEGTYGLGADVAVFHGNRAHGHRGGLRGFESSMWYFPADGVSIVLLSNRGNWYTDQPMDVLMAKLVKTVIGRR